MNRQIYQQYLQEYIDKAARDSDGSVRGIYEQLSQMQVKGPLARNREEKRRALADAQQAFLQHSHWPLEIILSHLGVEVPRR
ncbi:MAG: hypothetical protein JXA78_01870 [Anaerolineales bacterium]|nr:hypothetical protein [Anaerolineales bacterium]